MTERPRLVRSIPFWILLAGSLTSTAVGTWLVVDKISLMNTTLLDGSATGVEVYGGQAWVTLGAALVGAGLVGLVAALFLGVLRSFVEAPLTAVVPDAGTTDGSVLEDGTRTSTSDPALDSAPAQDEPVASR